MDSVKREKLEKIMDEVEGGETYESIYAKLRGVKITKYEVHDYLVTIGMWPGTPELVKECKDLLEL